VLQDPVHEGGPRNGPMARSSSHLPSLDGLRAISIVLVLLGHVNGTKGFGRVYFGVGDYAHLGVLVFFVISGFLITRLLLIEHEKTGRVSLKLFYARRALRLFPASYAFISMMWLLSIAGVIHLNARDIWHAITYTVNYLPDRSWQIGHLWSLSVEEQFYFVWPCIFVLFRPRRAGWIAAAVILFGPVARSMAWVLLRKTPYYDLELFPVMADSLAMGCLLAMVGAWLQKQRWYLQLFRPVYSIGMLVAILLINRYAGYTVVAVFGTSLIYVMIAVLIHRSVYCSDDLVGRFLNWPPVAFVGVLSYSLYVWQQPFLNRSSTAWVNAFPQNLALAVGAACCSYFVLEKPFLRLRRQLRGRVTEPSMIKV